MLSRSRPKKFGLAGFEPQLTRLSVQRDHWIMLLHRFNMSSFHLAAELMGRWMEGIVGALLRCCTLARHFLFTTYRCKEASVSHHRFKNHVKFVSLGVDISNDNDRACLCCVLWFCCRFWIQYRNVFVNPDIGHGTYCYDDDVLLSDCHAWDLPLMSSLSSTKTVVLHTEYPRPV